MMSDYIDWWNKKHQKYAQEEWVNKPSQFALWSSQYFPKEGKVLELGAGHGQDSRYFASLNYEVVSTDFSDKAIEYNLEKIPDELKKLITVMKVDLSQNLPFGNDSFDVVYCHMSIHYFDDLHTNEVFGEIYRVLKPGGILAVLVNSTSDPEYGQGKMLEPDYYEFSPGDRKHFFSVDYMDEKTKMFKSVVLDDQGTTFKDTEKGVKGLIRFVGNKA